MRDNWRLMTFFCALVLLPTVAVAAPFPSSSAVSGGAGFSGFGEPTFLPVDQAFRFDVLDQADRIQVTWRMPQGYYLYRHRISVPGLAEAGIPAGLPKHDEIFGDVEVFYKELNLIVPKDQIEGDEIVINYQGCADAGLCYPPQKRTVNILR